MTTHSETSHGPKCQYQGVEHYAPDYMKTHRQGAQEPSGMMHIKMHSTTSPVTTRTFWDDAHQNA